MKMSGSMRQTKSRVRRLVASLQSRPRFALPESTGRRVPDAHRSEPGFFFPVEPATLFCTVSEPTPSPRRFTSYCIPLERKSHFGAAKEQFP